MPQSRKYIEVTLYSISLHFCLYYAATQSTPPKSSPVMEDWVFNEKKNSDWFPKAAQISLEQYNNL